MAITASIKYIPQLDPSTFQLQDTTPYASPDDKANFSSRVVNILDDENNPLPGYANPIAFPYGGGDVLTISGLTQDYALNIQMVLTPIVSNPGSIYTAILDVATNRFLQAGLFNIQVAKNISPPLSPKADSVYRDNSIDVIIEMKNSQTALIYTDFTGSQDAIDRGQQIINNTQL